jgi:hypothetical protein
VRDGEWWSLIRYVAEDEPSSDAQFCYAAINPQTGACEEITFPARFGSPDSFFEVTEDSLFVSAHNQIRRYRFREKAWQAIPVPMESGAQITALNGRLYLATSDSFLEVNPDSAEVQILASSRRQPAANNLDLLWESHARVFHRPDKRLTVLTWTNLFTFTPASRTLNQAPSFPFDRQRCQMLPLFSGEGTQFLLNQNRQSSLLAFWNDATSVELLLEEPPPKGFPDRSLARVLKPPRWKWPPHYPLDASLILAEGKTLWLLTPRKVWTWVIKGPDPVAFADQRQATLFRFEPGFQEALPIPVQFEKDSQPIDPFDLEYEGDYRFTRSSSVYNYRENLVWLETPNGFVFTAPAFSGHWLIPKTLLAPRLEALRKSLRANVEADAQTNFRSQPQYRAGGAYVATNSAGPFKP